MTAIKRVKGSSKRATNRRNVKSQPTLSADHRSRSKDYLDQTEVEKLLTSAKAGRHGTRDSLLLMMIYRHGLRLIQDYLGHRDPKHTAHYTRVAGVRFEGLWG